MSNRFDYRGGVHEAWLAQHQEPIIDPSLPIIDAHHHLWVRSGAPYLLPEFAADLASGHRVVATVFAECHAMYRSHGPDALRPVGEMVFVAGIGAQSDAGAFDAAGVCRAAVGNVDLTLAEAGIGCAQNCRRRSAAWSTGLGVLGRRPRPSPHRCRPQAPGARGRACRHPCAGTARSRV